MVIVALCFWSVRLYVIQVLNNRKSGSTLPSSPSSMLNSLLWSETDAIINARDPMQNPGQTRIFYKPGQTHLTQMKRDLVDTR